MILVVINMLDYINSLLEKTTQKVKLNRCVLDC